MEIYVSGHLSRKKVTFYVQAHQFLADRIMCEVGVPNAGSSHFPFRWPDGS